jgi:hypothetical protein
MLVLSRSRLVRLALLAAVPVLLLGLLSQLALGLYGPFPALKNLRHFTFDSEQNMPSWLSSALLMVGALLTLWIAQIDQQRRRFWTIHSVVMVFCSIDESVSFHEALITMFSWLRSYGAMFYYPWILLGAVFCAGYGLYALRSLATIERAHALRFIVSGLVFVAGALVMEAASGVIASRVGEQTIAYALSASIEDILEIAGAILYLNAAATYLQAITAASDMRVAMRD